MINIKRLIASFGFAFEGLAHALRNDQNLRIHIFVALVAIAAAFFFGVSELELVALILVICIVLIAELINTTVERIVDFMVQEHVPEAKIIKDVAAGMTLIAAISAVIIGIIIFAPKILVSGS